MGSQNIWAKTRGWAFNTSFLVGFCMVINREILDKIGGVDETFYTGDDIDLSIRFRKAGYRMIVLPMVFVYHHGFQTGEKVHGKPSKPGGWNSRTMSDETNKHLIQKHGFISWWKTMCKADIPPWNNGSEDQTIKEIVGENDSIIELGCGHNKIFPHSLGVDLIPKGKEIPFVGGKSVADEIRNVETIKMGSKFKYVLAQQIIEHLTDPLFSLQHWVELMDEGGKLIISTPDEDKVDGINLNAQHKHVFTPVSLARLGDICGLKVENIYTTYDFFSFTAVFIKGDK
jgi:SAM-dependent methyltransferase